MKQTLSIILLATTFLFANWTETGKITRYNRSRFFYAVGSSALSQEAANASAVVNVKKQISMTVKSEELLETMDYEDNKGNSKSSSLYQSRIRLTTQGDVQGINVVETKQDKDGIYYGFAVLDRSNFSANSLIQIKEYRVELLQVYKLAKSSAESGNIKVAITNLSKARELIKKLVDTRTLLSSTYSLTKNESIPVSESDLASVYELCVSELEVKVIAGNKQELKIGAIPEEPFIVQISAAGMPVPNIPFYLKDGKKKLMKTYSNKSGMAVFFLGEKADTDKGRHSYDVVPSIKVSNKYRAKVRNLKKTFKYNVIGDPVHAKITVKVIGNLKSSRSAISTAVKKRLAKYDILEDNCACVNLVATVSAKETGYVQGVSAARTFLKSKVDVQFEIRDNHGKALTSFSKKAKGLGSDLESSAKKGISNIKIKQDIADLKKILKENQKRAVVKGVDTRLKGKIIVLPLKNTNYISSWYSMSQALTSMMTTKLINRGVQVLEREHIAKLMAEREFGEDEIDFAEYAGAKYAVVGSATATGGKIEVDIRVVEVKTGKSVVAASGTGYSLSDLRAVANSVAVKIAGNPPKIDNGKCCK